MIAKQQLKKMSEEEQLAFAADYKLKAKSGGAMLALAILFPIQLFLLGKVGLGILYFLTGGGFFVWWIIEIFLTPGRVRQYNEALAAEAIGNIKLMQD